MWPFFFSTDCKVTAGQHADRMLLYMYHTVAVAEYCTKSRVREATVEAKEFRETKWEGEREMRSKMK